MNEAFEVLNWYLGVVLISLALCVVAVSLPLSIYFGIKNWGKGSAID